MRCATSETSSPIDRDTLKRFSDRRDMDRQMLEHAVSRRIGAWSAVKQRHKEWLDREWATSWPDECERRIFHGQGGWSCGADCNAELRTGYCCGWRFLASSP
ncbi:MAG TPA: hypothetical protein VM165_08410 [Planctomycetaceae bacterium]|nr:hypothetical protein [Planctomycetaceae bacterium]